MLSSETEAQLLDLLTKLIEGEKTVEIQRKILAEDFRFNPVLAFDRLDSLRIGSLIPKSFKDFLEGSSISEKELYLLVRQYSSGNNGRLTYSDFLRLVLPSTDLALFECAASRRSYEFLRTHEWALTRVIEREVEFQRELETLKGELGQAEGFSAWKAFKALDLYDQGVLTRFTFVDFARKYGRYWFDTDIDALFRRIATCDDEVIEYKDFLEFVVPVYPADNSQAEDTEKIQGEEIQDEKIQEQGEGIDEKIQEQESFESDSAGERLLDTPQKKGAQKERDIKARALFGSPQDEMKGILAQQLQAEMQVEALKQHLAIQHSFSEVAVMRHFGWGATVSVDDLEQALQQLSIECERSEISRLVQRYGTDDNTLTRDGLRRLLLPSNEEYAERALVRDSEQLEEPAIQALRQLFSALVQVEEELQPYRRNLKEKATVEDLFLVIDKDQDGVISKEELNEALAQAGFDVTERDLLAMHERYARHSKGAIDLKAFQTELEPAEATLF